MQSFRFPALLSIILSAGCLFGRAQMNNSLPRLVKSNGLTQLFVNGKPYLILGGELGNSTTSDLDYMRPVWPKLKSMHLNTVLAPVYWELLEPQEGKFDFTLVDSMIAGARKQELKISDILKISKQTVDTHRKNMLHKNKLNNTGELIGKAIRYGWI